MYDLGLTISYKNNMKSDEYLTRITNYIFDSRFSRALLINGDWGCGKSYFVKNKLIPGIESTEVKQEQKVEDNPERKTYYKPLLVSLYGISSIDAIQEMMYLELLEKFTIGDKDSSLYSVLKNATLLGTKVIRGVGNFFNVGDSVGDISKIAGEQFLSSKKENVVLIFDDLERCQVDTIELMGFLNNLCENNGYRVIIIANEEEVARKENDIALAIQKQTALLDLYGKATQTVIEEQHKVKNDFLSTTISSIRKNRNEVKDTRFREILDRHVDELFEKNTLYERTREKLIGLTIHFESNVKEAYEDVLGNTVSEGRAEYLLKQKPLIVDSFNEVNHQNLRTLISVFIAIESILQYCSPDISTDLEEKCQEYEIDKTEIIESEKQKVISYIIRMAIKKAEGREAYIWKDSRYGSIGHGFLFGESVFGYAFVDEYWESLVADSERIKADFTKRITELLNLEIQKLQYNEHFDLSLFKLSEWYLDSDDAVQENIKNLKEELKDHMYYGREFKDIICMLMRINNPNFGMGLERKDSDLSERIFDAIDEPLRVPDATIVDSSDSVYDGWNKEEIQDYVSIMLTYFNEDGFEINKEMLRILSSDPGFVKEYRDYIQPLLDKIEEKELNSLKASETGSDIFETPDANFYEFFRERRDSYITKGQFFSLYGFEKFNNVILKGTPKDIFNLADAIHVVYNFGNLSDFLAADYAIVDKIWNSLKKDREEGRKIYNSENSRTREIALRRIERDLHEYKCALRNPRDEV